jgi:hypothetical protein
LANAEDGQQLISYEQKGIKKGACFGKELSRAYFVGVEEASHVNRCVNVSANGGVNPSLRSGFAFVRLPFPGRLTAVFCS